MQNATNYISPSQRSQVTRAGPPLAQGRGTTREMINTAVTLQDGGKETLGQLLDKQKPIPET